MTNSRSESNTSHSPIWDSSDPQRRPPPLPMREELTLNHIEGSVRLPRTSSISSNLYKQLGTKTSSQMLRISADDKTADIVQSISETTNTILEDLRSLIERSKDNATALLDLKQNITDAKRDQKIIDEIRAIVTFPPQESSKEEKSDIFKEKLDKIMQVIDTNALFHNTETQLLIDINKKLEAIEAFQDKSFSEKLEINNLISSYETLQQTNIAEMENMYSRKVELSAELARLDTYISHKKDSLNKLKERVKKLESRLEDIQLRLNKQREENKKSNKSSVIKKKVKQSAKSPSTPQNIRHFSLLDIHNRNPSIVTLAPSTVMNSPNNTDSISDKKGKRKTSWSRKVVNVMGLPFQHNNKENSPALLKNNEELAIQKKKKYPNNFGIKTVKTFRSFSTRI
ncbi:hypothetical protein T552_03523 [Pneumocystis carinii B80]|uniref:Uncharacterized protein n=1 Tax=Pneumocystis carinii (strain B80) TaxID=1408658 RepID=A0A0W4ZB79_PNEC8|nr:hypothetical protein T552_03523 [Pneumocystis carinii B80]KTW25663.1 hypothetical protein T552_03523 [Pneumocystis carinii B80]